MSHYDLRTYSKVLHPGDTAHLEPEVGCMRNARHDLREVTVDLAHENRYWEYSLALRAALRHGGRTLLDVGGGAGLFSAVAAKCGFDVTMTDIGDHASTVTAQTRVLGRPVKFVQRDFSIWEPAPFDIVAALSVIEHTDDALFFPSLLRAVKPGGLLILTTDFHPSGKPLVEGHLRTYNEVSMFSLFDLAGAQGFGSFGGVPDWSYHGDQVYNYSFASLVMQKKGHP